MQSVRRPDMLQSSNKQHIYEECPMKSVYSDKNCQEMPNFHMWPVQPADKMSNYMQLVKPSSLQSASTVKVQISVLV